MHQRLDDVPHHPLEKGWHKPVRHEHLFIDGCVQIWPDADFAKLGEYDCAGLLVTSFRPHDGAENALDALANWWRIARTYPSVRIALTADDIVAAKRERQAALILGTQGGDFLGQSLARLEMFYRLGLRVMIPSYNSRSTLGDGVLEPQNSGLSQLGRRWVAECNRIGLLIDLSHVGERTSLDVLELSQQPVVFSHSNPKKLVDNPRNITDEQIRKCAATGGVIGQTNWGPLNLRADATSRPTLDQFIDAIKYVADMVGIDHVSIGTDMSHGTYPDGDLIRSRAPQSGGRYGQLVEANPRSRLRYVEGFDDYGKLPNVAEAMSKRGFARADIDKVLGGNLLRVFRQVWKG
jgi:membrane dipeptidase